MLGNIHGTKRSLAQTHKRERAWVSEGRGRHSHDSKENDINTCDFCQGKHLPTGQGSNALLSTTIKKKKGKNGRGGRICLIGEKKSFYCFRFPILLGQQIFVSYSVWFCNSKSSLRVTLLRMGRILIIVTCITGCATIEQTLAVCIDW